MKNSPRGYTLHFNKVCLDYGLTRCVADECVYIKIESNDKHNPHIPAPSLATVSSTSTIIPAKYRIHDDCYYALRILIVSTYVDDNLLFIPLSFTKIVNLQLNYCAKIDSRNVANILMFAGDLLEILRVI